MTALVVILLAPFAVLTTVFALELFVGLGSSAAAAERRSGASAVIVVPAHDEGLVIGETLRSLKAALGERMRLLVVADNCTDSTAEIGREAGVEVLERRNLDQRGKGFALAFAADHLRSDPPDVFAVMDADCCIDKASLQALVASASAGRPSQTINLLRPDRSAPPLVQLSTFAFLIKNLVRQRGLQRMAGRVHLTGTGMAMPFSLFDASGHVRSSVVEDLALGLELSDAGHPPVLVTNAFVWSGGSTEQGTLTQRRRWEGGFIATALRWGPREVLHGIRSGNLRGVLAALDLMIPPLALFAILNLAVLCVAAGLTAVSGAKWWPILVQVSLLCIAGAGLLLAWAKEGRQFISLGALARLPLYMLWKLPMYLGLARGGAPKEWLRTGR
ncbi:glycosyltransferase family 2 protein [Sphingomonas daechungensis]|uniref:glycosyltransferase family 2 protein n=1 Tax=Sphingomonas daechungensis TaxID=1176646 RepID=UPI00378320CB